MHQRLKPFPLAFHVDQVWANHSTSPSPSARPGEREEKQGHLRRSVHLYRDVGKSASYSTDTSECMKFKHQKIRVNNYWDIQILYCIIYFFLFEHVTTTSHSEPHGICSIQVAAMMGFRPALVTFSLVTLCGASAALQVNFGDFTFRMLEHSVELLCLDQCCLSYFFMFQLLCLEHPMSIPFLLPKPKGPFIWFGQHFQAQHCGPCTHEGREEHWSSKDPANCRLFVHLLQQNDVIYHDDLFSNWKNKQLQFNIFSNQSIGSGIRCLAARNPPKAGPKMKAMVPAASPWKLRKGAEKVGLFFWVPWPTVLYLLSYIMIYALISCVLLNTVTVFLHFFLVR